MGISKQYDIIISDEAAQMLISHTRFLAQVSESAALRLVKDFKEKTNSLSQFRERNPYLNDPFLPERKYRKLLLENRYILIYQIKKDIVYIDAIVDTRQDYKWLLI